MESILYLVKIIVYIQATLILVVITLLYIGKLSFFYKGKKEAEEKEKIREILSHYFDSEKQMPPAVIKKLQKSILYVLLILKQMDKKYAKSSKVKKFVERLFHQVLQPTARKAARSSDWFNRYIAAFCYLYAPKFEDDGILIKLLKDESILISINAAKVLMQSKKPKTINTLIDVYSKLRRVPQAVYAEIIIDNQPHIASIIVKRLRSEKDNAVKIFCYGLLQHLPLTPNPPATLEQDLFSKDKNLQIAVLYFIARIPNKKNIQLLHRLSEDEDWEVRAVLATVLTLIKNQKTISLLEKLLNDPHWLVRVKAAQALGKKGKKGLALLEHQSLKLNPLAYEAAQEVLTSLVKK